MPIDDALARPTQEVETALRESLCFGQQRRERPERDRSRCPGRHDVGDVVSCRGGRPGPFGSEAGLANARRACQDEGHRVGLFQSGDDPLELDGTTHHGGVSLHRHSVSLARCQRCAACLSGAATRASTRARIPVSASHCPKLESRGDYGGAPVQSHRSGHLVPCSAKAAARRVRSRRSDGHRSTCQCRKGCRSPHGRCCGERGGASAFPCVEACGSEPRRADRPGKGSATRGAQIEPRDLGAGAEPTGSDRAAPRAGGEPGPRARPDPLRADVGLAGHLLPG